MPVTEPLSRETIRPNHRPKFGTYASAGAPNNAQRFTGAA